MSTELCLSHADKRGNGMQANRIDFENWPFHLSFGFSGSSVLYLSAYLAIYLHFFHVL